MGVERARRAAFAKLSRKAGRKMGEEGRDIDGSSSRRRSRLAMRKKKNRGIADA
jgi:hypothetical protein